LAERTLMTVMVKAIKIFKRMLNKDFKTLFKDHKHITSDKTT